ncbi:hypothetical protein Glove_167g111 [Diversispora epigaea]|uniref:Uncharacterized protein n=1 Tax=Diversispora epigaea TaxID=1348612 RepID=A0A397IWM1_9GLOM|nr:hypothetical protein Glove_167g111 [Diversispora epigaea]
MIEINKQGITDIPGEKEVKLISDLHLHYVWKYLVKLISSTGYSPKYNNQIKYVITILKIPKEQLDLTIVFSTLQQKYWELKPPFNSHLEGLVKILRKNLNRHSSIQYKEFIINEIVKQYQAGKCINNVFNKSSIFNKSKNYQNKGKHTVNDSVKSQIEDYILKLKDIKFSKLSLSKSIQSFLSSGKPFFKSFRSFNKPEHQIVFESSLNETINKYIQTTGSSSCPKNICDILKSQVIICFGWILFSNERSLVFLDTIAFSRLETHEDITTSVLDELFNMSDCACTLCTLYKEKLSKHAYQLIEEVKQLSSELNSLISQIIHKDISLNESKIKIKDFQSKIKILEMKLTLTQNESKPYKKDLPNNIHDYSLSALREAVPSNYAEKYKSHHRISNVILEVKQLEKELNNI